MTRYFFLTLLTLVLFGLLPVAAQVDSDGDGISDDIEFERGTNPFNPDTDGDGLNDGAEVSGGTDPNNRDTDGDGVWDNTEFAFGTSPTNPDTDGDGLSDRTETGWHATSDPKKRDSDEDGWEDGEEIANGYDPRDPRSPGIPKPSEIILNGISFTRDGVRIQVLENGGTQATLPNGAIWTQNPDGSGGGSPRLRQDRGRRFVDHAVSRQPRGSGGDQRRGNYPHHADD